MNSNLNVMSHLRRELEFLDSGGYRVGTGWSPRRYLEDSSICKRISGRLCDSYCPLLTFVPVLRQEEPAPCRYMPLNDAGETLTILYVTGTNDEIESAVIATNSAGFSATWPLEGNKLSYDAKLRKTSSSVSSTSVVGGRDVLGSRYRKGTADIRQPSLSLSGR